VPLAADGRAAGFGEPKDWKDLTPQQRATFRKVVKDAFVPDLMAPDRPFRPGLRVKGVKANPDLFEMTRENDGRATFSYGAERVPGQPEHGAQRATWRAARARAPR
jgi:hypothetical protein